MTEHEASGKSRRELAAELVVGDDAPSRDDHHRLLGFFVEDHLARSRRAQRLGDELAHVVAPLDDVDLLALEFVDDLANTRPSCTHAGANGVDIRIV